MRQIYLHAAFVSLCSMLMYGCVASEGDMDFLYSRQRETSGALKEIRKDVDWLKKEVKKEESILDLNEKVFGLENKLLELEQIIGEIHAQSEERFKEIEGRLPAGSRIAAPKPKTPPSQASGKKAAGSSGEKPEASAREKNPGENYDLGLKEFTGGNYSAARGLLKKYVAENPRSNKAQNAMFLIADSYFMEGLYEESILEYQNMIESWPTSPKVPLCQLKQGLALIKIGKPNDASLFFESLIETYPESPEAQKAKKHLKTLSAPSE